jgi:hypothetical protein
LALARVKTWIAGEVLTASDLNAEYNNILTNARSLISPLTGVLDMDGFELIMDGDADSSLTADTNNRLDVRLGGVDLFVFDGTAASLVNGFTFTAAATGSGASIASTGSDTNIPITVKGKGTGHVILGQATSTDVRLAADQPLTDSSGNELMKFVKAASAINEVTIANAATNNSPVILASGGDTNITIQLRPKGTGLIQVADGTDSSKGINIVTSSITTGVTRALTMSDCNVTLGLPRSYLAGLAMVNGTDAVNDIDIAAGACRDSGNAVDIVLASVLTKQLDAVWAVGTNAGGRASGAAIANTTYFVFLIRRPDTAVVDAAFDTSATGANIAANTNAAYTQIRRIGAIVRSGATILAFIQDGDKFVWTGGSVGDVSSTNPGTAAVTRTLTLPVGIRVEAILNASVSTASATGAASLRLSDLSTTDVAASAATAQVSGTYSGAGNTIITNSECRVHTNTSAQVRSRMGLSDANVSVIIGTTGWVDRRGRDD